ncbi:hypothetical protein K491DRAFT_434841 [Lophiostoma macrostomum CBS 122681]|uniref:Uncharacterized protein n=1 Tax=Lophiostoma macrostomum CBS 122681 TaxID=1314788 RepID=A0A6A6T9G1_9PLEO|nr:hypothetical protein K491DRAFT_434841 [Lophiostoma macrostomum CBS 122681]
MAQASADRHAVYLKAWTASLGRRGASWWSLDAWLVRAAWTSSSVIDYGNNDACARAQDDPEQTCYSYGIDFQNGGSYFQNSLSNDNFTFVSQYSGCQNDFAYNILVDPNGDQTLCSNTNLQPDDTNMLSTCPIEKSQLFSGPWSIVILSDNGDDPSIAYERDFSLSVGPQLTSTYTPTVTATSVVIPIVSNGNINSHRHVHLSPQPLHHHETLDHRNSHQIRHSKPRNHNLY